MNDLLNRLKKLSNDKNQTIKGTQDNDNLLEETNDNQDLTEKSLLERSEDEEKLESEDVIGDSGISTSHSVDSDGLINSSANILNNLETNLSAFANSKDCNDCEFLFTRGAESKEFGSFDVIGLVKDIVEYNTRHLPSDIDLTRNITVDALISRISSLEERLSEIYPEGSRGLKVTIPATPERIFHIVPSNECIYMNDSTLNGSECSADPAAPLHVGNTDCTVTPEGAGCLSIGAQNLTFAI